MRARTKRWEEMESRLFTRDEIAEAERFAERELLEMNLRELRQATGKTQVQLARAAKMTQSELSRAERREAPPGFRRCGVTSRGLGESSRWWHGSAARS